MNKIVEFVKTNRFNVTAWGVTALLVAALLGSAFWWTQVGAAPPASRPIPTAKPGQNQASVGLPAPVANSVTFPGIGRALQLKTNAPTRPRMDPVMYTVSRGDAMYSIAKQFNVKVDSIIYSNKGVIKYDNPQFLTPGLELTIPPVDGMYYTWKDGDTFESVAAKASVSTKVKPEDIINFPGNNIDLTDPKVKPGTLIFIPGGSRTLFDWSQLMPTISRVNNGSTGTSDFGHGACAAAGPVDNTFHSPTNSLAISGYDYSPSHLGIDLAATQGTPIYAAAAGIVTMAQGGDNYGYGNVVQIDHGNGFVSLYAHLSQINVTPCEIVGGGTLIGLAGSTGHAEGAHLHFEIRIGGANVNPHNYLQ